MSIKIHISLAGIAAVMLLLYSGCNRHDDCSLTKITSSGDYYYLEIEAEDTDVRPPFQVEEDRSRSGEGYIWVPNYPTVIPFKVLSDGTYRIWGRVFCTTGGGDSFNLQVDDGVKGNWNNIIHSDDWVWDRVSGKPGDEFNLSPGKHSLTIMPREPGSKLDGILVTNDPDFVPEGEVADLPAGREGKEYVWVEAEDGDIQHPFNREPHHRASGGHFIQVPEQITRVKVEVPVSGAYRILALCHAGAGDQNSIKIRIGDEGVFTNWNAVPIEQFGNWVWDEVNLERGKSGP